MKPKSLTSEVAKNIVFNLIYQSLMKNLGSLALLPFHSTLRVTFNAVRKEGARQSVSVRAQHSQSYMKTTEGSSIAVAY